MGINLTGINNINEFFSNLYFSYKFDPNEFDKNYRQNASQGGDQNQTSTDKLKKCKREFSELLFYCEKNKDFNKTTGYALLKFANSLLSALGFPTPTQTLVTIKNRVVPVYHEIRNSSNVPLLWVLLSLPPKSDKSFMDSCLFNTNLDYDKSTTSTTLNETLILDIFLSNTPPRWLIIISDNIVLIDRNKWEASRCLYFDTSIIYRDNNDQVIRAMSLLLHHNSLCNTVGKSLLDEIDENSNRHAVEVSKNLKFALRESIELLGNEVLYYYSKNKKDLVEIIRESSGNKDLEVDVASHLTIECLRYMYRLLFVFFIEARDELGYAPKTVCYRKGYSLEFLCDIATGNLKHNQDQSAEDSCFFHTSLEMLYSLIYNGYPSEKDQLDRAIAQSKISHHHLLVLEPLKAHIFDPKYTQTISKAKIRNSVMQKILNLMCMLKESNGLKRISYSTLGINQMGEVYEALLSYRGFIAQDDLYEVKRAEDKFKEFEAGYFVPLSELENYSQDEIVHQNINGLKSPRIHKKGSFVYRLAGRERETSASFYTPECLTKRLVKSALEDLLIKRSADEILKLTVCEPAMGSAAFLNETINQLAWAYLEKKQLELKDTIPINNLSQELQRVKMYIADRNIYGVDLNPVAVELAEVSLWLNTIYEGGFIPWFRSQLKNGNSLIGARRAVYSEEDVNYSSRGTKWFEYAPKSIKFTTNRDKTKEVYHFLLGDPGMAKYSEKEIVSLKPERMKLISNWRSAFLKPYSKEEFVRLLNISNSIDELWEELIEFQNKIEKATTDPLSVYGKDDTSLSRTTIRQKDEIYNNHYSSTTISNAWTYVRLKLVMDFWCALWFWPIDDADKLPNRSDFLFLIEQILDNSIIKTSSKNEKREIYAKDLESITTNDEGLTKNIFDLPLSVLQSVSIDELCSLDPTLTVVRKVAREQHFLHWELEFANLFKKNGGFDLIIGNPPWIKMGWEEKGVLSEKNPMFRIRKLDAAKISQERTNALKDKTTYAAYFSEYQAMKGSQNFLSAYQNYPDLKGQSPNLYKCFLPQAWLYQKEDGISAFVHEDGVYDATTGGILRKKLYPRLRKHYQFANEELLFRDVDHHKRFCLNVYGAPKRDISFQSINNLYVTNTIDQSYGSSSSISSIDEGIKDSNDNWNTSGYPKRILNIKKDELSLFAKLYDGNEIWEEAKLANIHNSDLFSVLKCFAKQKTLKSENIQIFYSTLWSETADQKNGIIKNNSHFPKSALDMIVSGPNFNVSSPLSKCARRLCIVNSDYESIDLTKIPLDYLPRCKYAPALSDDEYVKKTPDTQWGDKYIDDYRIFVRRMVALGNVRTLISAIAAPKIGHINVVFGIRLDNKIDLVMLQGLMSSLPLDFFIRTANKDGIDRNFIQGFPFFKKNNNILVRSLLLNCITSHYCSLFSEVWDDVFKNISWTKEDPRLNNSKFSNLTSTFTWDTPLRTDYERRQALIELDVLVAKLLGMTLEELKLIYRIYFYVMKSNEEDTFYDRNGRIVFTGASLSGLGYSRSEWNEIKDKTSGTFTRTIEDDTLSGGKVKRYIEYVAPFDRCDREKDYEIAWKFFEKLM